MFQKFFFEFPEEMLGIVRSEPSGDGIHRREPPVCQDDSGEVTLIERLEMLQGPAVVFLRLAREKGKGNAEGALARVNAHHIKKGHPVFVRFIRAI
jgi:hypothetical protein